MHFSVIIALILSLMPHTAMLHAGILDTLKLPSGTITMPGDTALLQGGCGSDPYQALAKYGCTRENNCIPSGPSGQGGINSGLACRLTKLFDAAAKSGCTPKIVSAYRSAAKQASMCGAGRSGCAPAGKSCHQYGLAVDVSCAGFLRDMVKKSPQFQLHFPYYGPHIQCSEHRVASCNPSTPPCKGGGPIANPGQADASSQNGSGNQASSPTESQQGGSSGAGQGSGGGSPTGGGSSPTGSSGQSGSGNSEQKNPVSNQSGINSGITPGEATTSSIFTCSPEKISGGESTTLEWSCPSGATTIRGGSSSSATPFNPKTALVGSIKLSPVKTTTYSVTCLKNTVIVAKASCDVVVTAPAKAPIVRISASPRTVYSGETTDIIWSAQNVRSCTLTGPGIASANITGRETSAELYKTSTFTLTCKQEKNIGQPIEKRVEVIVQSDEFDADTSSNGSLQPQETELLNPLQ